MRPKRVRNVTVSVSVRDADGQSDGRTGVVASHRSCVADVLARLLL